MATGDTQDQFFRLKRYLPSSWFGDTTPILDALLSAIATVNSFVYGLIQYAQLQTRIMSATGGWLDLIGSDYFGANGQRGAGQSDASYRNTIIVNLFRERATRHAVSQVLIDLTGNVPIIFEPGRVQDTGAYDAPASGYGVAGAYGSMLLPFQAFITAIRPAGSGIPSVAGYGISTGGYGQASWAEYASIDDVQVTVSDAEIYAAIDGVKPVGTIMWTQITGPQAPAVQADFSLLIGSSPIYFGATQSPIRLLGYHI